MASAQALRESPDLKFMFVCGGQGTRLLAVTGHSLKALAYLGDRPWVCEAIALLKGSFRNAQAVVNIHADQVAILKEEMGALPCDPFETYVETERGGVGHAISQFSNSLGEAAQIVVVLGDIVFDENFPAWLAASIERAAAAGAEAFAVVQKPRSKDTFDYDGLELGDDSRIAAVIPREAVNREALGASTLFQVGGVLWLNRNARKPIATLRRGTTFLGAISEVWRSGIRIHAGCYDGLIDDFGTAERYAQLRQQQTSKQK